MLWAYKRSALSLARLGQAVADSNPEWESDSLMYKRAYRRKGIASIAGEHGA